MFTSFPFDVYFISFLPDNKVYNGKGDGSGLNYDDPEWELISPHDPHSLIINIGDMCQVWSNGRFKAPLHRVLANKVKERFSEAFFYNPDYETIVKPEVETDVPKYSPLNWGEFRRARFEGDYADRGEEIQISHYRI